MADNVTVTTESGIGDTPAFADLEPWDDRLSIPTRDNCDLENPRQAFLWMFTAPPMVVGAPLVFPTEYYEHISYRMWQLGARPSAAPELKYQVTTGSMLDKRSAAGRWVPVDAPDIDGPSVDQVFDTLAPADRVALKEAVLRRLGLDAEATEPAEGQTIAELAQRLVVNPDRLVDTLRQVGMSVAGPQAYIDRDTSVRLAGILGMDDKL